MPDSQQGRRLGTYSCLSTLLQLFVSGRGIDTYDISGPHKDFWAVWLAWDTWLHNYCALNPLGDVMKATVAWKDSIYGTRQTRAPLEALPTPSVTVPPRPPSR